MDQAVAKSVSRSWWVPASKIRNAASTKFLFSANRLIGQACQFHQTSQSLSQNRRAWLVLSNAFSHNGHFASVFIPLLFRFSLVGRIWSFVDQTKKKTLIISFSSTWFAFINNFWNLTGLKLIYSPNIRVKWNCFEILRFKKKKGEKVQRSIKQKGKEKNGRLDHGQNILL